MAKRDSNNPCTRKEIAQLRDKNRRHRNMKESKNNREQQAQSKD